MPTADFFSRIGLFRVQDFLETTLCAELRNQMLSGVSQPGRVWKPGSDQDVVDPKLKQRSEITSIATATEALVKARLLSIIPQLEGHFKVALSDCQRPKFVIYKEGDFYSAHADSSVETSAPPSLKERKVAVTLFLNTEAAEPGQDSYCGGSLTFYGLIDEPPWNAFGLPLVGQEGLLVAFLPTVVHEVKRITYGVRYAITTWFF